MRILVRLLLSALFLFAGTVHLLDPGLFLAIMPPWIPCHLACVQISGICELLGGFALLIPETGVQLIAGWGLVLLLTAIFPANIYMVVDPQRTANSTFPLWALWARLPLQGVLIAWVWLVGLSRNPEMGVGS